MRRRSSSPSYLTRPFSLASLASSQIFFQSRLSSLSARRWLAVENSLSPVAAPIKLLLASIKLNYLSLDDVTGSCRPRPPFLTGIVLKVTTTGEKYLYFPKKRRGKRFPEEASPLPRTRTPCLFSHVTKISIMIWSHKPPQHNSPGDISPPFKWSQHNLTNFLYEVWIVSRM